VSSKQQRNFQSGNLATATDRGIVANESTFVEPFTGERMARREYQKPNVLKSKGRRPYYYVRYRVRVRDEKSGKFIRKQKWMMLGYCDEIGKREAERERDKLMEHVNGQVFHLRDQTPFREFAALYQRDFMPNLGGGTQQKYTSLIQTHLLPAFGQGALRDITTERLQAFLTEKKNAGLSWWSRSDLKNLLSGIFTMAIKWNYWAKANPVLGTEIGEKAWKRDNRALSDDEVHRVITALSEGSTVRLIVETLVATGMRISEVMGLRWKHLDFDRGRIYVRERNYRGEQGSPKSRKSRRDLKIQPNLIEKYRLRKPSNALPDDFVFQEDGEMLDERSILRYELRPILVANGLYFEGFGWHSFRRTHLTAFSEEGASAFETQDQAGHAKIETTTTYVRTSAERRDAVAQKVVKRLIPAHCEGIVGGPGVSRALQETVGALE
jgi:integrase